MTELQLEHSVSIFEAASILGIAVPNLRSILATSGMCPLWHLTGRVSMTCLARLYGTLYPRIQASA